MAQIDQQFSFGNGISIEMHVGNSLGSTGTNAKPPSDAPVIPSNVVTTKTVNTTVGNSHVVNPA